MWSYICCMHGHAEFRRWNSGRMLIGLRWRGKDGYSCRLSGSVKSSILWLAFTGKSQPNPENASGHRLSV